MKTYQKFAIGGLGGIVPVVMNLLVVDYETVFLNITLFVAVGYAIRVIVLFSVGGFWAALHNERNKKKLFELGILAPALLTAFINAQNIKQTTTIPEKATDTSGYSFIIKSAYAQQEIEVKFKTFSLPKENIFQQMWRGFTGATQKNTWFVIVGSYDDPRDAIFQANKINTDYKDFKAEVYEKPPSYEVVLGSNLTLEAAQALKTKAITSGLPKTTHLWQVEE